MPKPALMLLVKFPSALPPDEVEAVMEERAPQFRALTGLTQKFYLREKATGEYAGLYLWDSAESLASYRGSELRASIAEAYRAVGEPRIEVYEVISVLRDDVRER